jgi:UDP-N-acetyl-2-amino-2-deoxyglucuronate dehydrogenase
MYGVWQNINHPYIEVEDTATAIIRFKNGAVGNIVVSNAQKPGIYGKVHIHGSNGASAGVQTDGGAMFIAGQSTILEPPLNDIWTVPGEEAFLKEWHKMDTEEFNAADPVEYYMRLQNRDFILAAMEGREPLVTAREGRKTVELFDALYRSMREGKAVAWK